MAKEVPEYSDGVVRLTGYTTGDIADHLAGEDEETARRFGWWPSTSTTETATAAFTQWEDDWSHNGPTRTFAVRSELSGELLGGCQLRRHGADSAWTVSYWTAKQHRGEGVASRALCLLCRHAVSMGLSSLEAHIAQDNLASRAVAERTGFALVSQFTDDDGTAMARYVCSNPPGSAATTSR